MDHPGGVDGFEAGQHRVEDDERLAGREGPAVAQLLAERHVGQVLHDEVDGLAVAPGVVDRHDVRVDEVGGRAGLALEPLDEALVVQQVPVHDLERDDAVQPQVRPLVDHRHAAAGHRVVDPVAVVEDVTQQGVGECGHDRSSDRVRSARIWTFAANRLVSGCGPWARTDASPW